MALVVPLLMVNRMLEILLQLLAGQNYLTLSQMTLVCRVVSCFSPCLQWATKAKLSQAGSYFRAMTRRPSTILNPIQTKHSKYKLLINNNFHNNYHQ